MWVYAAGTPGPGADNGCLRAWRLDMIAGMEPSGSGYGTKHRHLHQDPTPLSVGSNKVCRGACLRFRLHLHPYHTYQRTETHLITAIAHSGYGSVHATADSNRVQSNKSEVLRYLPLWLADRWNEVGCVDRTIA